MRNLLILFSLMVVLTGCAKHQIPPQSIGYNKGLAAFGNQQILLNIIRAAKRLPLYFTGVGDVNFKDAVQPKLDVAAPIINGKAKTITFTPTLGLNNGFEGFQATNLNDKDFASQILSAIPPTTFQYYLDLGWPKEVLLNLLVGKISVTTGNLSLIEDESDMVCKSDKKKIRGYCRKISDQNTCSNRKPQMRTYISDQYRLTRKGPKYDEVGSVIFVNNGRSKCKRFHYQNFIRRLHILGIEISTITTPQGAYLNTSVFDSDGYEILSADNSGLLVNISLRSPESLIFYLRNSQHTIVSRKKFLPQSWQQ